MSDNKSSLSASMRPCYEKQSAALQELDDVQTLVHKYVKDDDLPAGSIGTVVHRYENGVAFVVEFCNPLHALATFRNDEVVPPRV